MAKKSAIKSPASRAAKQPAAAPADSGRWLFWLPVALSLIVFGTGLTNGLLGIDDHAATVDNPAVRDFKFFGAFNLGMYAPLTWAVYAIAYNLGGENPFTYHLFSAAVHAVNVYLVFRLILRLNAGQQTALFISLLFAIHPIQVESVAWIAGFSTPLFSMFYLLACLKYADYTDRPEHRRDYWLSLLLFVAACLAKSAAVSLPLALIVLDLWRKPDLPLRKRIAGYAPFFALSLAFGLLTIYSRMQSSIDSETASNSFGFVDRLLVLCYTPVFYWYNMLFPLKLNIYYSFDKVGGQFPWPYYISPAILAGVFYAAWRYRHNAPWLWFGLLFFFANISVMLPFVSQGTFDFCADHYNYLSIIGFGFVLVHGWSALQKRAPGAAGILRTAGYLWGILLIGLCLRQIRLWHDTISIVSHAIDNGYHQQGRMYQARAIAWANDRKDLPAAMRDFDKALEINPDLEDSYKYRGGLYGVTKQFEKSVADLTRYLELKPGDGEQYYNRGLSLLNLNRIPEAIADFNKTLELDPGFARAYRARGNAYNKIGETAKGQADLAEWEKRKNDLR